MEKEKYKLFKTPEILKDTNGFKDVNVFKKDWWNFKRMKRAEYQKTAGLFLLLGLWFHVLFPIGIIAGIIAIYKRIKKQE